jgi:F-type H+-transporting ATPase subunit b
MNRMKYWLMLLIVVMSLVSVPLSLAQDDHGDTTEEHTEAVATEDAEGEGGISALGINGGFLIAQIINFTLIAALLGAMLWKPAINMLDAREMKIQKGLEDAAAAAKARQNAETEAEKILAQARVEAQNVIDDARGRGDDVASNIEKEARAAAEKIQSDAQADAMAARDQQLGDLRDQVLSISVAVASRILGENIDAKKQKSLVDGFISDLPEGAKGLGGKVEVISAMPLSDAEQTKVQKAIGADSATFTVNPAILGGLIVRSADRVVDGSVRSNLSKVSQNLG